MTILPTPPRRDEHELIDDSGHDYAVFRKSFLDIRIVNRTFGGTAAVLKPLCRMIDHLRDDGMVSILDIGTGSADIPLALATRLDRIGRPFSITAIDNHPDVLRIAREETATEPRIRIEEGDVLDLPYPDGAFDFATCSLTFHHLGRDGCVRAMREMDRVTRHGWVVNDGERTWLTLLLLGAFTPLVTRNPLTRHDAIASVWRCFSRAEMVELVDQAGFADANVRRSQVGRIVIVRNKESSSFR